MPMQDIILSPSVNTQLTLSQNQAGVSVSQLLRWKYNLPQKLGGWNDFYPFSVSTGPIRDLHAFRSVAGVGYLAVGGLGQLSVIAVSSLGSTANTLTNITPQGFQSNPTVSVSITNGSNVLTVNDAGSSMSAFGAVRFDTPIAMPSTLVTGMYPINGVLGTGAYTVLLGVNSTATISSGGILPSFYTSSGSGQIGVLLPNNNFKEIVGLFYPFTAATSVGGITVQGNYEVTSIVDSTNFFIGSAAPAVTTVSSTSAVTMNGGDMSIWHYVVVGPQPAGGAYGAGLYGAGLYGIGTASPGGTAPTVAVTDWTLDNWGEILVACRENDVIYVWAPDLGLNNAEPITVGGAPPFSTGAFVSMPQQQMFAWGTSQTTGAQNRLLIRYSDIGSQQGYSQWITGVTNYAGQFQVPSGGLLMGGIQAPNYVVFWTDIEVWIAQWVGQPVVWSFSKIGTGVGLVGKHAAGVLAGIVYWMSGNNFYSLNANGVSVMPCTVFDYVFQQIDMTNAYKVCCAVNSLFNEITWYFPILASLGGTGENTNYVKLHVENSEYEWDYGTLNRTAWHDVTNIGNPVGTDSNGFIYQHETSPDAAGAVLNSALETGYFELGDGSGLVTIDWVLPDMKWSVTGGTTGTMLFTFFTVDYTGQPERQYGPYPVTQLIPYINTRMRGRYWRMRCENQDTGSFWRFGRVKFRWRYTGNR